MLVTMATLISSHVKDKNSTFTAPDEDMIFFVKGKILVFDQYLYNKSFSFAAIKLWNKLPLYIRNSDNLNVFKKALQKFNLES